MAERSPCCGVVIVGTLGISTAFGMLLLLPLYVQELGGDEADFGVSCLGGGAAVLCIGLDPLSRGLEAARRGGASATYGVGAVGASLVTGGWTPLVGIGVLLGTAWVVVYAATPMVMSRW